jgi:hypothetical protein
MIYRTLGELRSELSRRLGFGAQGSSGINSYLLDSFLLNAQEQLFASFEWRNLIKYDEKVTGVGQANYDWATDCDPTHLREIALWDGTRWVPMQEGITWEMRSDDTQSEPRRYERYDQMEVWPVPDAQYTIRRYYAAMPARFTQDNDRASIDDGLIFLHALTNAKLHYKQSDGEAYANQLNSMLDKLKAKNRGQAVFKRGSQYDTPVKPRQV